MTVLLGFSFFVTALIYASVGFGGGSTYSALLALANTDLAIFPLVSLTCNIIVVFGGTFAFSKWHPSCFRMVIPWAIPSVSAALIGGQIGAWLDARLIDPKWIRVTTAVLILYVSAQLFLRWATTIGL